MEYWILETGAVVYCDGAESAEVPDHAAVVRMRLLREFVATVMRRPETPVGLAQFVSGMQRFCEAVPDRVALREYMNDESDALCRAGSFPPEAYDDLDTYLTQAAGYDRRAYDLIFAESAEKVKDWALQHWQWIAVRSHTVDLLRPTAETLLRLCGGLRSIFSDEWVRLRYNLGTRDPSRWFADVPGSCLGSYRDIVKSQRAADISRCVV